MYAYVSFVALVSKSNIFNIFTSYEGHHCRFFAFHSVDVSIPWNAIQITPHVTAYKQLLLIQNGMKRTRFVLVLVQLQAYFF